jgi:hypothetical protein
LDVTVWVQDVTGPKQLFMGGADAAAQFHQTGHWCIVRHFHSGAATKA